MSGAGHVGLLRRHRDFRLLWGSEVTGKFGASVTSVAMPLIAVSTLGADSFEVGLLSAAAWLPWLVIGLPAGAWVDRMRRWPVMLVTAAASFLLFAVVPPAAWTGQLSVGLLLAVALLTGTCTVFFQTAYTAFLPGIVQPDDLAEGNAKLQGSASAAQIVGYGSAGLIGQTVGVVNAMFAHSATFLISLTALACIRHREPKRDPAAAPATALSTAIGEGLRLVATDSWLRSLTLCGAAMNLALMAYGAVQVVFLVRTVGLMPGAVGGLIAATGAGGIVGALLARRIARRVGTARALLLFLIGLTAFGLLIPLTSNGAGLLLYIAGGFLMQAGMVAGNVIYATFRQSYCPPELLGRLTTSAAFLNYGAIPLGALVGGWLGTILELRTAVWVTTAAVPLAALILLFSPVRRVRELPTTPLRGSVSTSVP